MEKQTPLYDRSKDPGNCGHMPRSVNCGEVGCVGERGETILPDTFMLPPTERTTPWPAYSMDQVIDAYWEGVSDGHSTPQ